MEPDEVRAEIERRKKRAKDLRIRETLWSLYDRHVGRYGASITKEQVYPALSETLKISDKSITFTMGQTIYHLIYKEGPSSEHETRRRGTHRELPEDEIVPATLELRVDGQRVFDFRITRCTTYGYDGPVWDDYLGEITSFIEGPWVLELTELLQKIKAYQKDVWNQRQAPKLEAEKKRFGL